MNTDTNVTTEPSQLTWQKVASIWVGLSIIGYLFGIYTHFDGWIMLIYLMYAPIAIPGLAVQTIVLCHYIPLAVRHRRIFQRQFYGLLIAYFILYFNAFFAPGGGEDINEKWENPIYGESGEIVAIISLVVATIIWIIMVVTAVNINQTHDEHISNEPTCAPSVQRNSSESLAKRFFASFYTPRWQHTVVIAAAWLGLSILIYGLCMRMHSDTWVRVKYITNITNVYIFFIVQSVILSALVPRAIHNRRGFGLFFFKFSAIYFAFLFNCLFAPSNNDAKFPSDLVYGNYCEIVSIISGVIAFAVWLSIVVTAIIVTITHPAQNINGNGDRLLAETSWWHSKNAQAFILVSELLTCVMWAYILFSVVRRFSLPVLTTHAIILALIVLVTIKYKGSVRHVLVGTAFVHFASYWIGANIYFNHFYTYH